MLVEAHTSHMDDTSYGEALSFKCTCRACLYFIFTISTDALERSDLFPTKGLVTTAADVTQAPVNNYTTLALVNACATPAMSLTRWGIFLWTIEVRYTVAMVPF